MRHNITNRNNKKLGLLAAIVGSICCHSLLASILVYSHFFDNEIIVSEGDNGIQAVMVDLSQFAAPELSLVEEQREIVSLELDVVIEPEEIIEQEETPPEVETPPETDIVETIDSEELPIIEELASEPESIVETVIEEIKPVEEPKPEVKPEPVVKPVKPKPPVRKPSQRQVRQEIDASNVAEQVVASTISDNTQYSATPSPISRRQPEYPRRALDLRIEGKVVILYDIDANGRVNNIRIVEAQPSNIFNRSVISAMKLWKYESRAAKDLTITIIFNRDKSIQLDNEDA